MTSPRRTRPTRFPFARPLTTLCASSALLVAFASASSCHKRELNAKTATDTVAPPIAVERARPSLTPCVRGDRLVGPERRTLIGIADIATLSTVDDLKARIKAVSASFAALGDWRGLFPAIYEVMTELSVDEISREEGSFSDPEAARKVTLVFGKSFLGNLHGHLTGGEVSPYWKAYYDYATECSESALTVLGTGANSHLSIDLAHAVAKVDDSFREDFIYFGDALFGGQIEMLDNLESKFGLDARPFFRAFFLGKGIDRVAGEGATSRLGFQAIRTEAWVNSRLLRNRGNLIGTEAAMDLAWKARDLILRQVN